jgi:hypothetical protein
VSLTKEQRARMWRWWNTRGSLDYDMGEVTTLDGQKAFALWRWTVMHLGNFASRRELIETAFLNEEAGRAS